MTENNTETQIVASPKREMRIVEDSGPMANLFDTARFEHLLRIASVMAGASLIPDHMWKDKAGVLAPEMVRGNCFLVVNQAVRWGMDPFAVVPETYVVGGKLGFQGKLVAAVINSRAPIKSNLDYEFTGTKGSDNFTIRVFATLKGEDKPREIKLSVGDAKTANDMWRKDPEQKLVYSGATKWARRHCPEIILGVLTEDDLEIIAAQEKNITPAPRAKVPKEVKTLPDKSIPQPTAASGSDSPEASTAAESVKSPEDTAQAGDVVESVQLAEIESLLLANNISDAEFIKAIIPQRWASKQAKTLDDLAPQNYGKILESFDIIKAVVKENRGQEAP